MNLKRSSRGRAIRLEGLDASLDTYMNWRDESRALDECYRRWTVAAKGGRDIAFERYVAALDREERAAGGYRHFVEHARVA
jgi:hypothetical protein